MDEGITVSDFHHGIGNSCLLLLHFGSGGIPFTVQETVFCQEELLDGPEETEWTK